MLGTWHKAPLWIQGSLQGFKEGLRQAREQEGLRLSQCYALRKAYTKARTKGRVTEEQLCCCVWSICRNTSSALLKGIALPYLSQMPQIRSPLFKMPAGTEIHPKYSLEFTIISCNLKNVFFPRRQHTKMLKDYYIWWLSGGISKLLNMYNWYKPKGTWFFFFW